MTDRTATTEPATRTLGTTACPLCGSDTRFKLRKNACDIVRCRKCGLEFVDPIPTDAELAAIYDDAEFYDYTGLDRAGEGGADASPAQPEAPTAPTTADRLPAESVMATDEVLDWAEARKGTQGTLLDVGCGMAPLLLRARDRGWSAHGLETSEWAVGFDRDTLGLDVRRGVLEGNPFQGETFDVITMIHCLEHMPRPVPSLEEARALLAPGGYLHVQVPNVASLGRRVVGRDWQPYAPPSHLWYFDHRTLSRVLTMAGFEVLEHEYRVLVPSAWRPNPELWDQTLPSVAETGAIDPDGWKRKVKRLVRTPLQWFGLMDSVHIWATARG